MARLTKKDWLEEGFKILSEFAQDRLRILYLCERLQVTRGSFYHHFTSIDNYIEELMRAWELKNTLDFIKTSNMGKTPQDRMKLLSLQVIKANQSVEAAIRSWCFYNQTVKAHLKRVDDIRLAFLVEIFSELEEDPSVAERKAKLDYATLIGLQQLYPNITPKEMQELYEVYWLNVV